MKQQKYNFDDAKKAYGGFLTALGFDWQNNPHMKDTPSRVTKAWVEDLARGCFEPAPKITAFDNDGSYDGIVCQTNIPVVSMCAHHNLPFFGYCHVAYIPQKDGKVIGLSTMPKRHMVAS